jgi:hypothetical protein
MKLVHNFRAHQQRGFEVEAQALWRLLQQRRRRLLGHAVGRISKGQGWGPLVMVVPGWLKAAAACRWGHVPLPTRRLCGRSVVVTLERRAANVPTLAATGATAGAAATGAVVAAAAAGVLLALGAPPAVSGPPNAAEPLNSSARWVWGSTGPPERRRRKSG